MTLNQLKLWAAVVKTGSITKAAKSLKMKQPSVSMALRDLSKDLDKNLYVPARSGNGITVTAFGFVVAYTTKNILVEKIKLEKKFKCKLR